MGRKIFGAIALLLVAAMMSFMGYQFYTDTPYTNDPINLIDVKADEVKGDTIYKVDNLVVWDAYAAHNEGTDEEKLSLMVMFEEKSGAYILSSMTVAKSDEIYSEIYDYIYNDEIPFGSLSCSCYIRCEGILSSTSDLYAEYTGRVQDETNRTLRQEYLAQVGAMALTKYYQFTYECSGQEDFAAYAAQKQSMNQVVCYVVWGIAGVFVVLAIVVLVLPKKKKTAPVAPKYAPPQAAVQPPVTPEPVLAPPASPQGPVTPVQPPQPVAPSPAVQYCPQCGTPHDPQGKFCAGCGARFDEY